MTLTHGSEAQAGRTLDLMVRQYVSIAVVRHSRHRQ